MSLDEVNRKIDAYIRKIERNHKQMLFYIYEAADLCAYSVARLFSRNAKYEPIDKYFPDVFVEERLLREAKEREMFTQQFLDFAQHFNRRFED